MAESEIKSLTEGLCLKPMRPETICVTGGAGFIGSHIIATLLDSCPSRRVLCVDSLVNSNLNGIKRIQQRFPGRLHFESCDICDVGSLESVLKRNGRFDCLVHCAGYKNVRESIVDPLHYYVNNVGGTLSVVQAMKRQQISRILFCSSCTVYGMADAPYFEDRTPCQPVSPYGRTKWMAEQILADMCRVDASFQAIAFRCFNPGGAHPSGLIGQTETKSTNLIPLCFDVCKGKRSHLEIFGDGTCQRDFVHVVDLAEAFLGAIDGLKETGFHVYNIGLGKPVTVLEVIAAVEQASQIPVPFVVGRPRAGDVAISFCNIEKVRKELKWEPKRDLHEICQDHWRFVKKWD